MRRRAWKWVLLAVVAVLAAAGTAWVWLRYDFEKVNWAWGVVAGVIAVYVVLDQVLGAGTGGTAAVAAHRRAVADELVELIRRDPTDEGLLRAVDEPYPLPVRWRNAPQRFLPSWRAIGRSSDAGPLDLAGRDGTLWSRYRAVPSGRLLLLGPAGAGKSVIALRMARELPAHREPCHALVGHPTLGPLAVAASRRLSATLADPAIVVRTTNRSAPMWHGG
ncbi:ATP-binding protein [Micromonospora sp. URMC 103]|uniref:ATP-binding protein n=1 Tax=Micromonospora sp. URMC 103 TaxID=3423406 RepID=UPI003F1AA736